MEPHSAAFKSRAALLFEEHQLSSHTSEPSNLPLVVRREAEDDIGTWEIYGKMSYRTEFLNLKIMLQQRRKELIEGELGLFSPPCPALPANPALQFQKSRNKPLRDALWTPSCLWRLIKVPPEQGGNWEVRFLNSFVTPLKFSLGPCSSRCSPWISTYSMHCCTGSRWTPSYFTILFWGSWKGRTSTTCHWSRKKHLEEQVKQVSATSSSRSCDLQATVILKALRWLVKFNKKFYLILILKAY